MEIKLLFTLISVLLIGIPYIIYFYSIHKGETKPHIYSRLLYVIITGIICFIQIQDQWIYRSIPLIIMSIFCLLSFMLAIKYWTNDITMSDRIFLVLWLLSIPLWIYVENPLFSVILLVIIDFFATLPTIRKTIVDSTSENKYVYLIWSIWIFFSLLLIEEYSIVNSLYLIFLLFINILLYLIIAFKNKTLTLKNYLKL